MTQSSAFISHGAPMVAIQEDPYHEQIANYFSAFLKPTGIVVVSAHWQTAGPIQISSSPKPGIVHDFHGFPPELYEIDYPVPGSPELALQVSSLLAAEGIQNSLNPTHRLDHGVWVPLRIAYPQADIPVVQVSLPLMGGPADVLRMGKALRVLRKENILILGSGGAVHNLGELRWHGKEGTPDRWAKEFQDWLFDRLKVADIESLLHYEEEAPHAAKAQPTAEHFLPIFFTLGASLPEDKLAVIHEGFQYHSLSMFSFALTIMESLRGISE